MIDLAHAAKLQNAFGPCSSTYETMDLAEIIKDIVSCGSEREWISMRLDIESIILDQMGVPGDEYDRTMAGYRERLKQYMEVSLC